MNAGDCKSQNRLLSVNGVKHKGIAFPYADAARDIAFE